MTDLPTITVVTPSFNAAATIEETLRSVREQDYPHVEHIVVDGGSTDGTVGILERAAGLRFVSEPDRGLSHAMNKGVAISPAVRSWAGSTPTTSISPARCAPWARPSPRARGRWATGRCLIIDGAGARSAGRDGLQELPPAPLLARAVPDAELLSAPATFARREAYARHPFREDYAMSMDYDVFLQLATGRRPDLLDRDLACFRMMEGTLSMSSFERQFAEHAEQARTHGAGHPGVRRGQPGDEPPDRDRLPRHARRALRAQRRRFAPGLRRPLPCPARVTTPALSCLLGRLPAFLRDPVADLIWKIPGSDRLYQLLISRLKPAS